MQTMQTLRPVLLGAMLLGAPMALLAQSANTPENPPANLPDSMQTGPQTPNGALPGNDIGTGASLPVSAKASNITPSDTSSPIAPRAPAPVTGADASVSALLGAANQAISSGQTNTANEALEEAETQLLQASVPATQTDYTSHDPVVTQIGQARQALGNNNPSGATQIINQILASGAPELSQ